MGGPISYFVVHHTSRIHSQSQGGGWDTPSLEKELGVVVLEAKLLWTETSAKHILATEKKG